MPLAPPGFRLPATTTIGRVALQVADLDRSLAFYEDIIGFQRIERGTRGGRPHALLGAGAGGDALLELREHPGARPVPRRGRLGIYHFAVLLPTRRDLGRFLTHAMAQGIHVGLADHAVSEASYLVDPDGMTIEVYRDRPPSEWTVTPEGEIVVTIDPLKTTQVIDAAGTRAYDGLPAGTTIGHMHFFVGDLASAETFYYDGLGFDKAAWSIPGALFVSAGGYHHHVGLNTWAAGAPVATDDDARLLEWELTLPDRQAVETARESLRLAGADVATEGDAAARDPWGNRVRLRAGTADR